MIRFLSLTIVFVCLRNQTMLRPNFSNKNTNVAVEHGATAGLVSRSVLFGFLLGSVEHYSAQTCKTTATLAPVLFCWHSSSENFVN